MALQYVGLSKATGLDPLTIPVPSGVQSGDLLIVNAGGGVRGTPPGWTAIDGTGGGGFYRFATSSAEAAFSASQDVQSASPGAMAAYRGTSAVVVRAAITSQALTVPAYTPAQANVTVGLSVHAQPSETTSYSSATTFGWPTVRLAETGPTTQAKVYLADAQEPAGVAQPSRGLGPQSAAGLYAAHHLYLTVIDNTAPNAPILLSPATNEALNRDATNRFAWQFSDQDATSTQSSYSLRYRVVGAASWTTVTASTPNNFRDFPAGTFATGSYEWQVQTSDSGGMTGPWSSSGFFSAATPPAGPAITAPVNGTTIGQSSAVVTWSATSQESYQVRSVADSAGAADTATVYYDTGELVSTSVRSVTVPLLTNSRYEHLQVRTKSSGLFSPWSSVRVLVSYTPPAIPLVSVAPSQTVPTQYTSNDAIAVAMLNPTPSGGQPAVAYMNLYVQAMADGDPYRPRNAAVRIGTLLPAGTFTDRAVASGVEYIYAAEAVAANGTSALSGWVGDVRDLTETAGDDLAYEDDDYDPAYYA